MKILVTGSSGTIGTRLCEKLAERKQDFVGVDKKHNRWSKEIDRKTKILNLLKEVEVKRMPVADMIIHLAANARVYNLVLKPELAKENMITTFNVLEFCRKNDISRFVFASSREAYGNSRKIKHKEEDVRIELCESPYTASKIAGEALAQAYCKCYGIDFVIVRFSNVYGMYDDSDRVVPLFIRRAMQNKDLVVYGREKLLDFTYIDDAVDGLLKVIERFEIVKDNTFNIASGKGTKIVDVARLIKKELNSKSKIKTESNRRGEVLKFIADISKARKLLNYRPKVNIDEGIRKSIEWYKNFL